jgi:hypothetical protein
MPRCGGWGAALSVTLFGNRTAANTKTARPFSTRRVAGFGERAGCVAPVLPRPEHQRAVKKREAATCRKVCCRSDSEELAFSGPLPSALVVPTPRRECAGRCQARSAASFRTWVHRHCASPKTSSACPAASSRSSSSSQARSFLPSSASMRSPKARPRRAGRRPATTPESIRHSRFSRPCPSDRVSVSSWPGSGSAVATSCAMRSTPSMTSSPSTTSASVPRPRAGSATK